MLRLLTTVAVLVATALVAAPATAASRTYFDEKRDVPEGTDLQRVTLVYGDRWLKIRTHHRDLVPRPRYAAGMSVFLDIDPTDPGPELRLGTGLMDGTDYSLLAVEGFKRSRDVQMVRCEYRVRLDYRRDVAKIRLAPDCVDGVATVNVAVKASAEQGRLRSHDWLTGPRALHAVPRL